MSETSSGLKQNVAGVLCYVFWWVGAIVMLILEGSNGYVKFHAFQSIIVFAIFTVAMIIFGVIPVISFFMVPLLGAFAFIVWLVMIVVTAQNKTYKLPWVGALAEKWAGTAA